MERSDTPATSATLAIDGAWSPSLVRDTMASTTAARFRSRRATRPSVVEGPGLAGMSAPGVLDEVVGSVADVQSTAAVPAPPQVAADGGLPIVGGSGRRVPEVGTVEENVTPLGVDADLTGHPLESQWHAPSI